MQGVVLLVVIGCAAHGKYILNLMNNLRLKEDVSSQRTWTICMLFIDKIRKIQETSNLCCCEFVCLLFHNLKKRDKSSEILYKRKNYTKMIISI